MIDLISSRRFWKASKRSVDPFTGECRVFNNSSLRKLARAIRRGKVPEPRMFIIETALDKAKRHPEKYLHRVARVAKYGR
ncbi:MAG: hypothetical protein C5B54_07985 [Acidobacteria bacterium]|nr:MAG: hypothetical protein C5B54_07985 [Acidobacteriota bacterium]